MKQYPSIPSKINGELDIYAFGKLDGSNIRVEWSPKSGFSKFGTRKRLLSEKDDHLGRAVTIFKKEWEAHLPKIFARQRWHHNVVLFFEFFGDKSFAGYHFDDDNHQLVLIDVDVYKKGLISPRDFVDIFGALPIPQVLYRGKCNSSFIESVRASKLEGMPFEGVVCKAHHPKRGNIMFKVKSQAWLNKVKEKYGDKPELVEDLI
jgi:hypothetical protein